MTAPRSKPPIRIKRADEDRQRELIEQAQAERDHAAREAIRRQESSRPHGDYEQSFHSSVG